VRALCACRAILIRFLLYFRVLGKLTWLTAARITLGDAPAAIALAIADCAADSAAPSTDAWATVKCQSWNVFGTSDQLTTGYFRSRVSSWRRDRNGRHQEGEEKGSV